MDLNGLPVNYDTYASSFQPIHQLLQRCRTGFTNAAASMSCIVRSHAFLLVESTVMVKRLLHFIISFFGIFAHVQR
jgi:hypothetical protein